MPTNTVLGRRWWVLTGLAISSLVAAGPPSSVRAQTPFKAGIADPVNTVLAWWMAQAAGFYNAQGLDVSILNMNGGSRGADELAAGRIDAMHVGLSSVIRLNASGGDLRLIGSLSNVVRFTLFGAPGVRTGADLKGGVIAVSTAGSESDTTVNLALERFGLKRSDVSFKDYGGGPARLAAVRTGEVKATMLNEPFSTLARQQGVNVLVDLAAEQTPWVFSGITVRTASLKDARERERLKRFLRATIEGNYAALTDAGRAKAVLGNELHNTTERTIDIAFDDFAKQSPLNLDPSRKGGENILAQLVPGRGKLDDYIDTSLLDEIRNEGFIEAMEQKYNKR
jgi:ABC-type nitrate/sulfonate/bicarbonate transport system substrate-binding protein